MRWTKKKQTHTDLSISVVVTIQQKVLKTKNKY